MGTSYEGMGQPVTSHKTRLSLLSQASGKLNDNTIEMRMRAISEWE